MTDKMGVGFRELVDEFETPLYVYNEELIQRRFREMKDAIPYEPLKMLYAVKANSNPAVMHTLREEGAGMEVVSPGEIYLARKVLEVPPEDVFFTSNGASRDEIAYAVDQEVWFNADSLDQLRTYGKLNRDSKVSVRINPEVGAGHHRHVITAGPDSKFGMQSSDITQIKSIASEYGLTVTGVHMHVGSRFLDSAPFMEAVSNLLSYAQQFPDIEFADVGGGVGIPYSPDEHTLDLKDFGSKLSEQFENSGLTLMTENGRFYVAEAGQLLTTVTDRKETGKYTFIETDTGFNHLVRPMIYGAYHEIVNLSNPDGELEKVVVAGNICESGDVFTQNEDGIETREIPRAVKGDVLAILNAGAYGFTMSSNYNTRPRPAEVMIENGRAQLIRRRETIADLIRTIEGSEDLEGLYES